jgi:uncharacterized protein YdcH (DUF465 family)
MQIPKVMTTKRRAPMSHVPHELSEDFPEHREKIHNLKETNAHFAKLADEYHALNREIHRMETRVQPTAEEFEKEWRRKRVALKDEIAAILRA